jgi:L-alanine-DL-glutamate epimerase-like enolase superfamily enzyme
LRIPFKQSFKHASAERKTTQSVWVEVESHDGVRGCGEGCPREYVTGESVSSALAFIHDIECDLENITDLQRLTLWVESQRTAIDANPAAWCAVELALLDVLAREANQSVEAMLSLPPIERPFQYSAVLGAENPPVFEQQLQRYLQMGFRDLKVKLSGTPEDLERVSLLKTAAASVRSLRFDANNLWKTPAEAIQHVRRLDLPAFALEEPLGPGCYNDAAEIAKATGLRIILDESLLRIEQLEALRGSAGLWIVNLRISKLGGLLRSLRVADRAGTLGIPIISGCQVGETSLLTRAALTVAQAHIGRSLLAQEGAFGTLLLERDVVEPPLMFGRGGLLDASAFGFATAAGFGLAPNAQPLTEI